MSLKKQKLQTTTKIGDLEGELQTYIKRQNPQLGDSDEITYREVLDCRYAYINQLLGEEMQATEHFNENYHAKIERKDLQTKNLNKALEKQATFGDRVADKIAQFGGSWPFIITLSFFYWLGLF